MAKTDERQLDTFNQQLRASPQYQQFLRSIGANLDVAPGQAWRLSDDQREQAKQWVAQQYGDLGKGLEVDISGNVNQNEGFGKQAKKWGPIVGAGAATLFGVPGLWGGLLGGGAPAAGGSLGGLYAATPANITSQGVSAGLGAGTGGGMGLWGSILKGIGKGSDLLGAVGAGAGAYSQGEAANRGSKLDAQMALEQLLMARERDLLTRQIAREQEGRAGGQDAWRRMIAAERMKAPGPQPMLSPYSIAPRARTGTELQGADAMSQEVMKRLRGGNPIPEVRERPMNVDLGLTDPGMLERILGIASPVGSYIGNRNRPIVYQQR